MSMRQDHIPCPTRCVPVSDFVYMFLAGYNAFYRKILITWMHNRKLRPCQPTHVQE